MKPINTRQLVVVLGLAAVAGVADMTCRAKANGRG
jgi:hypothetical protein